MSIVYGQDYQGYLIPFAPWLSRLSVAVWPRKPPSPLVFLPISTHFTATPEFDFPSHTLDPQFESGRKVEPRAFEVQLSRPPTRALRPMNSE